MESLRIPLPPSLLSLSHALSSPSPLHPLSLPPDDDLTPLRRRRFDQRDVPEEDIEVEVPLESFSGKVDEYLAQEAVRREVGKRFRHFLKTYHTGEPGSEADGEALYVQRIKEMLRQNRTSLEVSYVHLSTAQPVFGMWLAEHPKPMLEIFHM